MSPVPTPLVPVPPDRRFDGVAALLSSICLWHCLALPLVLGAVPAMVPLAAIMHGPGWLHWLLPNIRRAEPDALTVMA